MPTLDWIGKDKVINHHNDVPYKVLERKYSYDEDGDSCALSDIDLQKWNITFKKIPRDIEHI